MTAGCIEWGVASRAMHGQAESGDRYVVVPAGDGVLVGVVDGLGHGVEASRAAARAVATLEAHIGETVLSAARRCHESLSGTRGVVMSLARFSPEDHTVTWLGVGNVEGWLLRQPPERAPDEPLVLRGGVVGHLMPALIASIVPVSRDDTLIFATDGVADGFSALADRQRSPQAIADAILSAHGKASDDALVLVARYIPPGGAS